MTTTRAWMIRWLLAVGTLHLLAGALLPWLAGASVLDGYHHDIAAALWQGEAPSQARTLQAWWMALFGPTIQVVGLWMIALVCLADRLHEPAGWRWLGAGMLLWAPQDMLLSLRAACWPHVWIDVLALAVTLPPLAWLQWHDRKRTA